MRISLYIRNILAALIIFIGIPCLAAKAGDLELSADSISRDYETRTLLLEGNVKISYEREYIFCHKATINMKSQTITAEGNVILENDETYIEGEKIVYNYKTKLGEIHKGLVQAGQVVFIGDIIKKNSASKFLASNAKYTSCATCPPGWSFSGKEIEAEVGGYAYIKYPVMRIVDFPVLILPWLLIPLKSKRQSGLLVPSLENSSTGGTAFTLPYFWAISQSQDITYSLKTYEKRGLKQKAEYRYVLNENSKGSINTAILNDRAFTSEGGPTGYKESFRRGFLSYRHFYELPDNFIHRASFDLISDLRYPRDFSDELGGHGDPALENKMSITKNSNTQHFSVEADYYTNLLKEYTNADNSDAVHRFPELQYSLTERELLNTNVFFKFDFNYTNFARRNFSYDDDDAGAGRKPTTAHDGQFDYSGNQHDLIRTGQRLIFKPRLSYPFHIGNFIDINPSVFYNETQYRFNVSPVTPIVDYSKNAELRYLQTDISFKTKYSAIYGTNNPNSSLIKHEIEPELIYSRIPVADRPNNIFFGNFSDQPYSRHNEVVNDSDFEGPSGIQFDYHDRLFNKDLATFILNNYLIRKNYSSNASSYQKFFTYRLTQSYDLNQARQENPHPWSVINSLLNVRLKNFETHTTADYYPYAKIANWTTRLKFINDRRNYLELTYSENSIVNDDQTDTVGQRTQTLGTGVGFITKRLDLLGKTNYSIQTAQLENWEYVASVKPPGDCWSIRFGHKKTLGADTVFKISLNFEFNGI
ncbi:MAG: hypothetical protein A2Z20_10590 [Bdellovibrionales bacterium RBG_16_40_8]|nr:MAG: hypothetical protein A2Z20_10590 [Bdellovibrionales bacterium RBG_16_40_8]